MANEVKNRSCRVKGVGKNSGRSISAENPSGLRRKSGGLELAPKSLRRLGRKFMTDCSAGELEKIGL